MFARVNGEGVRVIVIEDNVRVAEGLARVLRRRGFESLVCCTFCAAQQCIDNPSLLADGAIVDVVLDHGHTGEELVAMLRKRFTSIPVMLVTGYEGTDIRLAVVKKPVRRSELDAFLLDVTMNSTRLAPQLRDAIRIIAKTHELSVQEARILTLLAEGSVRASLAADLRVSEDTVKSRIKGLLAKTETTDTSELLAVILRQAALQGSSSSSGSQVC